MLKVTYALEFPPLRPFCPPSGKGVRSICLPLALLSLADWLTHWQSDVCHLVFHGRLYPSPMSPLTSVTQTFMVNSLSCSLDPGYWGVT